MPQCSGISINALAGEAGDSTFQWLAVGLAPIGDLLQSSIQAISTASTQPGFAVSMTMVSGPGPTYVDEVLLVQMTGVVASGSHVATNFVLSTILPNAGRVFNANTDGMRIRINNQHTDVVSFLVQGCGIYSDAAGGGTVDCADVMPHLEAILAAVQQVKVNAA
jgi:hypothetical protein